MNLTERLYSKCIKTNNCWIWTGATSSGYGTIRDENQKNDGAHRISWRLHNNQEIPTGMVIMHKCDNKLCINPDHLELGTVKNNIQDMINKNRRNPKNHIEKLKNESGSLNRNAKLTNEQVIEIRKLYNSGKRQFEIANDFGISKALVWTIIHNKSWKGFDPSVTQVVNEFIKG